MSNLESFGKQDIPPPSSEDEGRTRIHTTVELRAGNSAANSLRSALRRHDSIVTRNQEQQQRLQRYAIVLTPSEASHRSTEAQPGTPTASSSLVPQRPDTASTLVGTATSQRQQQPGPSSETPSLTPTLYHTLSRTSEHFKSGEGPSLKAPNTRLKRQSIDSSLFVKPQESADSTNMSSQPLLQTAPGKRIALPTRVEPKVFFANERTFLSWLNFTVILGGLAVGLLNFGDKVGKISAALFTAVAMLAMMYALFTFHWRAKSIRQRGQGGFDDRLGPTVLALALLAAVIVNFVLRAVEG